MQLLACDTEVQKIKQQSLMRWRRMFGLLSSQERSHLWSTNPSRYLKRQRLTGLWKVASILGRYFLFHDRMISSPLLNEYGFKTFGMCICDVRKSATTYAYFLLQAFNLGNLDYFVHIVKFSVVYVLFQCDLLKQKSLNIA